MLRSTSSFRLALATLLLLAALCFTPALHADILRFQLRGAGGPSLSGANELPPNPSTGTGYEFEDGITFDTTLNRLYIRIVWQLSEPAVAQHIHRGDLNSNGGVLAALPNPENPQFATLDTSVDLQPADVTLLLAGGLYINVHTASYPGGDIRANIVPDTVVSNTNDSGPGSLRAALALAASLPDVDLVTFAPELSGQTIHLTTAAGGGHDASAFRITDSVAIMANNLPKGITISGENLGGRRLFYVESSASLQIDSVTLTGGNSLRDQQGGGAVLVLGTLYLDRCTLANNTANPSSGSVGGGAVMNHGTAILVSCTVAHNSSGGNGGGLKSETGMLSLRHTTIFRNGGGSSTIGGVYSPSGNLFLDSTIISGNLTGDLGDEPGPGAYLLSGKNFIGNFSGSSPAILTGNLRLDPDGLQDNGGPTKTIALRWNSPAVNAAPFSVITHDQRGRPVYAAPDLGAYELPEQQIAISYNGTTYDSGNATIDLGQVEQNDSNFFTFYVNSVGAGNLTFPTPNVAVNGEHAYAFYGTQLTGPLAPGASTALTVRALSGVAGLQRASLTINSNASDANPFVINLQADFVDTKTIPPTVSSPATGETSPATFMLSFRLPEAAKSGSVRVTIANDEHSQTLVLGSQYETEGDHSASIDASALPPGTYTLTLEYQDAADHPAKSTTVTGVVIRPAAPLHTVVAAKGDAAPGRGVAPGLPADAVLASFNSPAIDELGHVTYVAKWTANNGKIKGTGLFLGETCLGLIGGDASAIGGTGAKWKTFGDPVISQNSVACIATLSGVKSGTGTVIVATLGTSALQKVAQLGDPGTASGAKFKAFKNLALTNGELTFLAQLASGSGTPKVTGSDDWGLWHLPVGQSSPELSLREGATAGGLTIKTLSTFLPGNGSNGAGRGYVVVPEGGDAQLSALAFFTDKVKKQGLVFRDIGQTEFTPLSVAGDVATGHVQGLTFASYGPPARNSAETTTFLGKLTTGNGITSANATGIFVGPNNGGKFQTIIKLGDELPNVIKFSALKDPVLSEDDKVAFQATLKGSSIKGANAQTLWTWSDNGGLDLIAQGGSNAGGALNDLPTGAEWKSFTSLAIAGGGRGPIFTGTLATGKGGVTSANATGVWARDLFGTLRTVTRPGQTVDGKTIKTFSLLKATVGNSGTTRHYNDRGQILWQATFKEDGSQAIVVSEIP